MGIPLKIYILMDQKLMYIMEELQSLFQNECKMIEILLRFVSILPKSEKKNDFIFIMVIHKFLKIILMRSCLRPRIHVSTSISNQIHVFYI